MKGWHIEQLQVKAGNKLVLDMDSLHVPEGAITLLTGPNGIGKTTLLETIAGLRIPSRGELRVDGSPLWLEGKLQRQALLSNGVALQHSHAQWFAATVAEELRYSLAPLGLNHEEMNNRLPGLLAATGLDEDCLSRQPWHLSGGQQRRLALACAMALQPRWLLLDEPTAGLDAAGIEQLAKLLRAHRAGGGGALIVTHDWEALWPIADYVIEMRPGGTVIMRSREEIMGSWLENQPTVNLTLRMTEQAAVLAALRQRGIAIQGVRADEAITPETLADLIVRRKMEADSRSAKAGETAATEPMDSSSAALPLTGPPQQKGYWSNRDPRILWAAYLLISLGLISQSSWSGLLLGTVLTAGIVWQVRGALAAWQGAIRFFAGFAIVAVMVSSIEWQPAGWDAQAASTSGLQFGKIFLIMLLGLALAQLVTPFRMQRGLEQGLSWLQKLKFPVRTLALTVSLIFRFIPLLTAEWSRFAAITLARGKQPARPGRVPLRQLPRMLVPFLISMLRLSEEMAEALEVRGFGESGVQSSRLYRLQIQPADYRLLAAGMALYLFLMLTGRWLS
ncbi:ATP-binding cassette domain-containing protein [Paenibacillus daejeonensis]|uniref:ATP-binding cassette domain-containing protein n=1 Tax=Paenibacillus daejeonensis TaxID=135193 RepID=UPI00037BEA6F|nr:ATP-binding cassette domain-containing protein [Paenibacillus daejeonensis]